MNACGCGQTGKQENHSNNKPSTKKKQKYEIPNINKTNELMFVCFFLFWKLLCVWPRKGAVWEFCKIISFGGSIWSRNFVVKMMKSINAVQLGSASHRQPALVEGLQWSALHPLERKRHENVYTKKKKRGQVNGSRSSPWTRMNGSIPDWFLLAKGTRDCILCRRIWFPISLRVWRGPATCCRLFSRRSLQACTGQHRNAISISSLHHLPGSVESEDQSTSHWRERPKRCKEEERKKKHYNFTDDGKAIHLEQTTL